MNRYPPKVAATLQLRLVDKAHPLVISIDRERRVREIQGDAARYGYAANQVEPLLQTAGLTDAAAVATMSSTAPTDVPLVGTGGFTSSPESLADCMGRLGMTPDGPPALVVDRATYDGADVGVVVTVNTLPTDAGEPAVLDVIVVGSECSDADIAGAQRFEFAVTP